MLRQLSQEGIYSAEFIQIWIDEINFVLQSQASLDNGGAGRRARSWLVSEALSVAEGEESRF